MQDGRIYMYVLYERLSRSRAMLLQRPTTYRLLYACVMKCPHIYPYIQQRTTYILLLHFLLARHIYEATTATCMPFFITVS